MPPGNAESLRRFESNDFFRCPSRTTKLQHVIKRGRLYRIQFCPVGADNTRVSFPPTGCRIQRHDPLFHDSSMTISLCTSLQYLCCSLYLSLNLGISTIRRAVDLHGLRKSDSIG